MGAPGLDRREEGALLRAAPSGGRQLISLSRSKVNQPIKWQQDVRSSQATCACPCVPLPQGCTGPLQELSAAEERPASPSSISSTNILLHTEQLPPTQGGGLSLQLTPLNHFPVLQGGPC